MKKIFILLTVVVLTASFFVSCNNSAPPAASCTVKFMNGDVLFDSQVVTAGEKIKEPNVAPTASGYVFRGWYIKDSNSSNKWDFLIDTVTGNTTLYAIWDKLLPVGGQIFYIYPYDNGAEYRLFTSDEKEITVYKFDEMKKAKYYTISGDKTGLDRFYVYDNETRDENTGEYPAAVYAKGGLAEDKYWGWSDESCGAGNIIIGSGKTNTEAIIGEGGKGIPTDYSPNIWEYAKACRDNKVGGCDDWFIPSKQELYQLSSSGMEPKWFTHVDVWTSSEENKYYAYFWCGFFNYWSSGIKSGSYRNVVAVRSF